MGLRDTQTRWNAACYSGEDSIGRKLVTNPAVFRRVGSILYNCCQIAILCLLSLLLRWISACRFGVCLKTMGRLGNVAAGAQTH